MLIYSWGYILPWKTFYQNDDI